VQRRLDGLGFDTGINGKFDEATRSVIKRWQAARNYPATGYLNQLQHKALLSEIVSTRVAASDDSDEETVHYSCRSGGGRHYHRVGSGPGAFFGGLGGLFRSSRCSVASIGRQKADHPLGIRIRNSFPRNSKRRPFAGGLFVLIGG
jgi:peptidoglycan hydrolase-like protein with peptidoglycan-binding domain